MKWDPWNEFEKDAEVLPIKEPPCKDCDYWKPIRCYGKDGSFDGIICCHAPEDMEVDFSCYRYKGER